MILKLTYRTKTEDRDMVYGLSNSILTYIINNDVLSRNLHRTLDIEKEECICTVKDTKPYAGEIMDKHEVYKLRVSSVNGTDGNYTVYKVGTYKSVIEYLKNMKEIFEMAYRISIGIEEKTELI